MHYHIIFQEHPILTNHQTYYISLTNADTTGNNIIKGSYTFDSYTETEISRPSGGLGDGKGGENGHGDGGEGGPRDGSDRPEKPPSKDGSDNNGDDDESGANGFNNVIKLALSLIFVLIL